MPVYKRPYAPPRKINQDLDRVRAYWDSLKRREAKIPFWDDVRPSALPELRSRLVMMEASDKPVRFRFAFGLVGDEVQREYEGDLATKFLDEIEIRPPLRFLLSQCSATVESGEPTLYRHPAESRDGSNKRGYSRLLLPLWGEGHIGMLLGCFAWE